MKEKEEAEENKSKKMGKKVRNGTERRNLIHIEEDALGIIFAYYKKCHSFNTDHNVSTQMLWVYIKQEIE